MKIRYGYKCGKELHRKKQMLRKKDKLAVSEKFVGADLVSAHRKHKHRKYFYCFDVEARFIEPARS